MTNSSLQEIGKRIRSRRKEMGYSQAMLAEKIGIGAAHMSDIENGKKNLGVKTFIRIAEELQTSADWLIRADVSATNAIVSNEISDLLADCSAEESQELFELMIHIKRVLQKNRM